MEVGKHVVALGLSLCLAANSFAGVVSFAAAPVDNGFTDPASMTINRGVMAPGQVKLVLTADPTFPAVSAADLIIGMTAARDTGNASRILGFQYAMDMDTTPDTIDDVFTFLAPPTPDYFPTYANDLFIGGSRPNNLTVESFVLGTLTLDLTNLGDGMYEVFIDAGQDQDQSVFYDLAGGTDSITTAGGVATITIVPEPATMSLIGLGALAALWRRRRSNG
jgi:hypothetical protein